MTTRATTLFLSALFLGLLACGDDTSGSGGSGTTTTSATGTGGGGTTSTTTTGAGGSTGTGGEQSGGGGHGQGGGVSDAPTVELSLSTTTSAPGGTVDATVTVTNFVLEAPQGQPNQAGHGHYHIYLDNASGGNYLVADQEPTTSFKIPVATSGGAHSIRVSLGANDHAALVPAVEDKVDITVQ